MLSEVGRSADRQNGAAGFKKLAQTRNRFGGGESAPPAKVLNRYVLLTSSGGSVLGGWLIAAGRAAAAAAPFVGRVERRDRPVHKYQHVEFVTQAAFVQLRRKDNLEREFKTLQQPPRPSRRH